MQGNAPRPCRGRLHAVRRAGAGGIGPRVAVQRYRRSTGSRAATRPTSRARRRGCRSTTTARRARASSSSWRSRPATGQKIGSLFFNFGGPGGTGRRHVEAAGADAFPALNKHFDIIGMDPRGVGAERALDRLQGQPGDAKASTRSRSRRPTTSTCARSIRKDLRYIARCVDAQPPDPAARLDRQRGARHRPAAPGRRRQQAHLLRLLVRHVPGRRRTRACSRTTTARWSSTGRSTPTPTSTIRPTT